MKTQQNKKFFFSTLKQFQKVDYNQLENKKRAKAILSDVDKLQPEDLIPEAVFNFKKFIEATLI